MRIKAVPVSIKYYEGRKSRVVKSFSQFVFGSALNILRAYRDYAPLRFFGTASMVCLIPGIFFGGFVSWHWATQGRISPYISLGIISLLLFSIGIMLALLGLVADMLDRLLSNQERILEKMKESQYPIAQKKLKQR